MDLLEGLNNKQEEAVLTTEGPVMVMAGAGSGKTTVLTRRIAYLINQVGISPFSILAVTFTNKAAREMKERVADLINFDTRNMWVSTFHSFCAKLLRIEVDYLEGFTSNFQILDEEDSLKALKEAIKQKGLVKDNDKEINPKSMRKLISKSKNLEDFSILDPRQKLLFDQCYEIYQDYLKANNAMDFDDLIINVVELFKTCPQVLERYQDKFNYILIDEFQDTNHYQFELICLLAKKHRNIFVVGDEDQSIYSFRGARIQNVKDFRKTFRETHLILLEENYRSTKPILDLANRLISNNKDRIVKNLFTSNLKVTGPVYYRCDGDKTEVNLVVEKIKELIGQGYNYCDFAVMYRSNYLSRPYEDIFMRQQIPYVIYGGLSFFARKEIKDIVAYLRLILNHNDNLAFKRIINEPKRKIGETTINKLEELAIYRGVSLYEASKEFNNSNINKFREMIEELDSKVDTLTLFEFYDELLDKTNYKAYLTINDEEERLENVFEFKSVLYESFKQYEGTNRNILASLLLDLALKTDTDEKREDDNVVKLTTYHQAKGLEFKVVFMVAMEEEIFPNINVFGSASEIEEERRICYVGVTRAKERLYLTSARDRVLYGRSTSGRESRFITEMGINPIFVPTPTKREPNFGIKQIGYKDSPKPIKKPQPDNPFKIGDKVSHVAFGDGLVVDVPDSKMVRVAFKAPYGIKLLLANHPSIKKIS